MRSKRYICVRVRKNNGIIEALFTRDEDGQEEIVLINVLADDNEYEEGKMYWWGSERAFPH